MIFTYEGDQFYKDGQPYRILSGAMHYFRIVPEYWEDRLKKLKACGFNTIRNFNRVFKELTGYTPRTLPKDYRFIRSLKEYKDNGFDPTLHGSEILEK